MKFRIFSVLLLSLYFAGIAFAQTATLGPASAYSTDPANVRRNQSPLNMFLKLALENKPKFSFNAATKKEFEDWKSQAYPKVMATLRDFPQRVPLNPTLVAEWEHDGVIEQRWMIDVCKYMSASLLINYPKDIKPGEKRPAILCWHGHGPDGKAPIMGMMHQELPKMPSLNANTIMD